LPPGIIVPVITPLLPDYTLDEDAFRRQLRRLITGGVDALFVGGTSGVGPLIPDKEWQRTVETAIDETGDSLPLLVGVAETSTPRAIDRIHLLESVGCRHYVLTPTFYIGISTQTEFLSHYGRCAEASGMNMVIYNIPACTGSGIPLETILEMAQRGWSTTCKDSSGDKSFFESLCRQGRDVGLSVYQGLRPDFEWLASIGAAGSVPVPANVEPETFAAAWKAAIGGERDSLERLQKRVDLLWESLVEGYDFLSGNVYALAKLGIGDGTIIPPLQPANTSRQRAIDSLLAGSSNRG